MPITTNSQDEAIVPIETMGMLLHQNSTLHTTGPRTLLGGMFVRRECWKLSWYGKITVILFSILAFVFGLYASYPFLAITDLASHRVMIVESWIHPHTMPQVAQEIIRQNYEKVLIVRSVYKVGDKHISGEYDDYVASDLVQFGVPKERIHTVFLEATNKDRTYNSALAAKRWLNDKNIVTDSIDVATLGSHARRSRLLFQKAFGNGVKVGVLSAKDRTFDPEHWWRSSEGVREVPFEAFAYFYAKFLFHP